MHRLGSSLKLCCINLHASRALQGLPFRGFAERLGSAVLPSIEAARQAEREAKLAARQAADEAEVVVPEVPHVLPFTRW